MRDAVAGAQVKLVLIENAVLTYSNLMTAMETYYNK